MKKFVINLVIIVITVITSSYSYGQTFMVSDMKLSDQLSQQERQKRQKEALGSVIELQIYDNAIRAVLNHDEKDAVIFNKEKEDKYICSNEGGYVGVLLLNKFFGYIKSINIYFYRNDEWIQTITAKRK